MTAAALADSLDTLASAMFIVDATAIQVTSGIDRCLIGLGLATSVAMRLPDTAFQAIFVVVTSTAMAGWLYLLCLPLVWAFG